MPSLAVLRTLIREIATQERSPRVNEPDLVMDDPEKVAAYTRAGREDGVMAPVYLYHCAQVCDVIKPGDTVLDLACGPATQLGLIARVNPDVNFIGVDLSPEMLKRAKTYVDEQNLKNVQLKEGAITNLNMFDENSIDVVISTVALHHLPDRDALEQTFSEINRVLKPDGGLYLVDFGHLKSEKSINTFAYQYEDRQAELFTLDYLYSLRAAFSFTEFEQLTKKYLTKAKIFSTFVIPYMVAIKSEARATEVDKEKQQKLLNIKQSLPDYHKVDLADLMVFFRLGGLKNKYLKS